MASSVKQFPSTTFERFQLRFTANAAQPTSTIMKRVGVVGGTRGLGKALVDFYAAEPNTNVFATARYMAPQEHPKNVRWLSNIDIAEETAGSKIVAQYSGEGPVDILYVTAGYFKTETLDKPNWDDEVKMYTISAIGPVFLIHHLFQEGLLKSGSKIVLVSSESGSIGLRHEKEGGGNCVSLAVLFHNTSDFFFRCPSRFQDGSQHGRSTSVHGLETERHHSNDDPSWLHAYRHDQRSGI